MLIHHLYTFFQGTLTIPKTRDLVHRPVERYEEMLRHTKFKKLEDNPKNEDMKTELAAFLQDLKKSSQPEGSVSEDIVPANTQLSQNYVNI